MPRLNSDGLRQMPASRVTDLLEERLGVRLPLVLHLKIALLMGAGEQGIRVVDPGPGGDSYTESLDFDKLAALVNSDPVTPFET